MTEIANLHVCLVSPPGYPHSDALLDPASYLAHQLARFGGDVTIDRNRLRHDAVNLVFGAHSGFDSKWCQAFSCIFVNLEQLAAGGARVAPAYLKLLSTSAVIDYDIRNPPVYTNSPEDVPLMGFGHAEHLAPAPGDVMPIAHRPIDLLFLGSLNNRRRELISRIEATGRRVTIAPSPLYGPDRDALIRQAKAVLNTPFYDSALFEQVRATLCQSLGTPVLSERLPGTCVPPEWESCVHWFDANQIDSVFGSSFDRPDFQAKLQAQLSRFQLLDPIGSHADIAVFASGVWQVHCGMSIGQTREDAWLFGPPQADYVGRKAAPLFQYLDDATAQIEQCVAEQRYETALRRIVHAVNSNFCLPEVKHRGLYYPELDRCIEALAAAQPPVVARPLRGDGVTLFVATELYQVGGHTKVLLDMARAVKRPFIVLTDVFDTYGGMLTSAPWIESLFAGIQVICLPDGDLTGKVENLRRLTAALAVDQIVYLQHHQDPVAFVGTLGHPCPRKVFIHHADHNPSLGCTLHEVRHVDLSSGILSLCAAQLDAPTSLMPMHVPDLGARMSSQVSGRNYSVATSGRPGKFARNGEFALHKLIATTLKAISGHFHFIGPLDDDWLTTIRAHLIDIGMDADRFVPHGLVPSLWQTLLTLDVDVYLGSAPVGGGRAAIEAQGAGLPVVVFKGYETGSLLENYSLYASPELGWSTLDELHERLTQVGEQLQPLAVRARGYYDELYSYSAFRSALAELLGSHSVRKEVAAPSAARKDRSRLSQTQRTGRRSSNAAKQHRPNIGDRVSA